MIDLPVDPALPPQLSLLWGQIQDAVERLTRSIINIEAEELEYEGPSGTENSIAAILAHLARSNLDYASDLGASITEAEAARFGPWRDENGRLPTIRGRSKDDLLDLIRLSLGYVRRTIDEFKDEDLPTKVQYGTDEATVRWCLWHVADHHMEHLGHIRTLRRQWRESRIRSGDDFEVPGSREFGSRLEGPHEPRCIGRVGQA